MIPAASSALAALLIAGFGSAVTEPGGHVRHGPARRLQRRPRRH
jgi:hypothetical protein